MNNARKYLTRLSRLVRSAPAALAAASTLIALAGPAALGLVADAAELLDGTPLEFDTAWIEHQITRGIATIGALIGVASAAFKRLSPVVDALRGWGD